VATKHLVARTRIARFVEPESLGAAGRACATVCWFHNGARVGDLIGDPKTAGIRVLHVAIVRWRMRELAGAVRHVGGGYVSRSAMPAMRVE